MLSYVKTRAAEKINETDKSGIVEADDVLIDDDELVDYFGELYAKRPKQFRFESGHKMMIKLLVKHVENMLDQNGINTGLKKFSVKEKKKPKHSTKMSSFNIK